nr:uncharacterized protein CI109_003360 [Kwoniella shandongensis]KAA5528072.1 hypothetical protein CI109_003360 [Kwoniella shandongensis]
MPRRSQDGATTDNLENTATTIEQLVLGPGLRPNITDKMGPLPSTTPDLHPISALLSAQDSYVSSRDHVLLDAILRLLPPSATTSRILIQDYFDGPIHTGWHAITKYTFIRQFQLYSSMTLEDQLLGMESGWVAVYLMILAFSVRFSTLDHLQQLFPQRSQEEISGLPDLLYRASLVALDVSNYLVVPQIRHIQAALLYINFLFHFGDSAEKANLALRHLDSAISTAQWLGLDIIGSDSNKAPLLDPAFLHVSPRAAYETSKQLLHMLSFMDGTIYKRAGLWRMDAAVNVAVPENLNDTDLLHMTFPVERPSDEFTDSSLSILGSSFACVIRRHSRKDRSDHELSYDQIMDYDRALREVLKSILTLPDRNAQSAWMMNHLFSSIHNRLLRIHRPYMVKGYHDAQWTFSSHASVESAKAIIETQKLMLPWPHLRPGFVTRWILGSAIVLAVNSVLRSEQENHAAQHESGREDLAQAIAILQSEVNHGIATEVNLGCIRAIQAMSDSMGLESATHSVHGASDMRLQSYFDEVKRRILAPVSTDDVAPSDLQSNPQQLFDFFGDANTLFDLSSFMADYDTAFGGLSGPDGVPR